MIERMYYVLLTALIALLIAGLFGAGFAIGCRLPELDEEERRRR
jgi:hypothetical protein